MNAGLRIRITDPDDAYLGLEIHASNERFGGTTFIYAGLNELSEFAARIADFPASAEDQRTYEFGSRNAHGAGGYCGLRLFTLDSAGHAELEITLDDDEPRFGPGTAKLRIPFEAAGLDRFVRRLCVVERERDGEAVLGGGRPIHE